MCRKEILARVTIVKIDRVKIGKKNKTPHVFHPNRPKGKIMKSGSRIAKARYSTRKKSVRERSAWGTEGLVISRPLFEREL